MQTKGGNFMAKMADLQIGKYDLTLKISRTILMDAFSSNPEMAEKIVNGSNITITQAYDFCKIALLSMCKAHESSFDQNKIQEIFDYTEDCIIEEDGVEMVATDYLVKKVMELVSLGFTKSDNAEKIEITLSQKNPN